MKIGLIPPYAVGPVEERDFALGFARLAEELGFESIWVVEHVVLPDEYRSTYPYDPGGRMPYGTATPQPDPLVWLAAASAVTERIRLATGVLVAPQRSPLLLAKQVATLDRLSGGRFVLGVGAGWLREEFEVLGVPFEGRGARLDECIAALRAIWRGDPEGVAFEGARISFPRVRVTPTPCRGSVPIVVGGHTPAAARRAGRLGDGFFPARGSPEEIAALYRLAREEADRAGRDPAALELTVADSGLFGPEAAARVDRWRRAGAARILVPVPSFDVREMEERLAAFGDRVIAPLGSAGAPEVGAR